jgi:hypothetical protein
MPAMNATETSLLEALRDLERAAAAPKSFPGGVLSALQRIDSLAAELRGDAPQDLRHYLARKSYEKARLFLEEMEAAQSSAAQASS